jgi:class 3 adenylate cyclase
VNGYSSFQLGKTQLEDLSAERLELFHQVLDGMRVDGDMVAVAAPSERSNERWRAWFEESGRRGASPRAAARRWRAHEVADVTARLGEVAIPTLVVHREDNLIVSDAHARFLADRIPDAELVLLPGSDNLVYAGDVDGVIDAIADFAGASVEGAPTNRVLTTVLFTDIVSSTNHAVVLGDRRWTALLDLHDSLARQLIGRHGGALVKSTGDGLLVTFDSPGDALRCAAGLREELADLGIEIRSGIHVGEAHRRGSDVSGVAVHLAARVMALAEPGEMLVSSAVPPLMVGSEIEFEDRGTHELRGVPGSWPLYAARI